MIASLYPLLRSALFRFNAETAHNISLKGLSFAEGLGLLKMLCKPYPMAQTRVMGLNFPNPVGLAAGMDKDAECIDGFACLGFGFIEVGTFTPKPQDGNDKPRLFRLIPQEAIINRMGFNNHGIDAALERLAGPRRTSAIVGVNIGKNKVTPNEDAASDYLYCMRAAYQYADYITVNLSSPNTPGLRALQEADSAAALLDTLKKEQKLLQERHGKYVPLVFKVAPDLADADIAALSKVFVDGGLDGICATNTTLDRSAVLQNPLHEQAGGLSGAPLRVRATEVISAFAQTKLPVIGVGGIMRGEDAVEKIKAGASLVQLYTGFVYKGPELIHSCVANMKQS